MYVDIVFNMLTNIKKCQLNLVDLAIDIVTK